MQSTLGMISSQCRHVRIAVQALTRPYFKSETIGTNPFQPRHYSRTPQYAKRSRRSEDANREILQPIAYPRGEAASAQPKRLDVKHDLPSLCSPSRIYRIPSWANNVESCEKILGYSFKDKAQCLKALNMDREGLSCFVMRDGITQVTLEDNQRLSQLGLSVLDLYTTKLVYRNASLAVQDMRSFRFRVNAYAHLAVLCLAADLPTCVIQHRKVFSVDATTVERLHGTLFTAIIGAVFEDGGNDSAEYVMHKLGISRSFRVDHDKTQYRYALDNAQADVVDRKVITKTTASTQFITFDHKTHVDSDIKHEMPINDGRLTQVLPPQNEQIPNSFLSLLSDDLDIPDSNISFDASPHAKAKAHFEGQLRSHHEKSEIQHIDSRISQTLPPDDKDQTSDSRVFRPPGLSLQKSDETYETHEAHQADDGENKIAGRDQNDAPTTPGSPSPLPSSTATGAATATVWSNLNYITDRREEAIPAWTTTTPPSDN